MLDVALGVIGVVAVGLAYGVAEGLFYGTLTETKWGRRLVIVGAFVGAVFLVVLTLRLLL